jgi:mannose-1-phosphate guanylyltransferase
MAIFPTECATEKQMLHAMIMAGGGGTRFWPRSRRRHPKQFLRLAGEETLLQQAVGRLEAQVPPERTWIITAGDHVGEVSRQVSQVPSQQIIGEPCGRDTAPCIGLGAALIARQDADAVMLVTPADHVIEPAQEFRRGVHVAEQMATEHPQALVTFGITPTYPATGYGYIHRGEVLTTRQGVTIYQVQGFREKPQPDVAEQFVVSGQYYWNSGIFVWKAATILEALRQHHPALHAAVVRIAQTWGTPAWEKTFRSEYEALTRISIDYAVMEHAKEVLVAQAPFKWDDVGSWLAVERMHPQDAEGNTVKARHAGLKTSRCVIVADDEHLVATVGVSDLLVIQHGDVTLVAHRDEEAAIKKLVESLGGRGLEKYL